MTRPRTKGLAGGAIAAALLIGAIARADGLLPEGWLRPPTPAAEETPAVPRCCGHDSTCCARQADIDALKPSRWPEEPIAIDVDALPVAEIAESPGPEVDASVGALTVYDGSWRPHPPLPRRPSQNTVGLVAPGAAGVIRVGSPDLFMSMVQAPFFRDPAMWSRGRGLEYTWDAALPADQPLSWESVDVHPDGGLLYRSFTGRFDRRTGRTTAGARWSGRAVDVARGLVYALRVRRGSDEEIRFLLPAASDFFDRRPFTTVTLPLGKATSTVARHAASVFDVRVWSAIGARPAREIGASFLLGASRASGESKPTVVVAIDEMD